MSQLAGKIRQKYPGQYDDMSDTDLETAILKKYPDYQDLVEEPITPEVEKQPGMLGRAWDWMTTTVAKAPGEFLRNIATSIDEPTLERSPLEAAVRGGISGMIGGMPGEEELPFIGRGGLAGEVDISLSPLGLGTLAAKPITRGVRAGISGITGLRRSSRLGKLGKVTEEIPFLERKVPLGARPEIFPEPPVRSSPIENLRVALKGSKKPTAKQIEINKLEREEKFGRARGVQVKGEQDVPGFMAQFKGKHPKVVTEPIRPKLEQNDIDSLFKQIGEIEDMPEQIRAHKAFYKLLDGEVLQNSERKVLEQIFGKDVIDTIPKGGKGRETLLETFSLAKGMKATADVSFMLRQGINHVGRRSWRRTFIPQLKAFASENYHQISQGLRDTARNAELKKKAGLHFTSLKSFGTREEAIMSTWVERIPGFGRLARASNRAYTTAGNVMRDGAFDTLYDDYAKYYKSVKKLAKDADELKEAELFNPDTLYRARKIAESANVSTGRGGLGKLEAVAEELNAGLFAPRLISARIRTINRVFNPISYIKQDPVMRREHLRQLRSIVGVAMASASIFKLAGADIQIDPRSTDFMKSKIGKTRFDPMGGYQQYFTPFFRLFTNTGVSARTGKEYTLGEGLSDDALQMMIRSITNKASPLVQLGMTLMRREDPVGKPVDLTSLNPYENTIMNTFTPMITEDLLELMKEDPSLIPVLMPLGALGAGIQVHER